MKHFTDALFEEINDATDYQIASPEELARLLPTYINHIEKGLKRDYQVEYDGKPTLDSSSYILPNGVLLNGPREGHTEVRAAVIECLPEEVRNMICDPDCEEPTDEMMENFSNIMEYVYKNVIRLNSASANTYIDLELLALNKAQLYTLEDWLDLVLYNNKKIDLSIHDSVSNQYIFNGVLSVKNYSPQDIINLIKYIQTNKRPPSTTVWEAIAPAHHRENKYFTDTLLKGETAD